MSFGNTDRFYSVINQNCMEPETDHRSRYRDMDMEVSSNRIRFFAYVTLCYIIYHHAV